MGDLLDGYDTIAAWDEMFDGDGGPRAHYRTLYEQVQTSSRADFDERCTTRDRVFRDRGITFAYLGEERPFPLDLVPRVVSAAEWATIELGVRQRVLALERFLADVYGPGAILRDGVVPRRLVVTSNHFHRAVFGIEPPGKVRVHVAGIDLIRDGEGRLRVLEDNLRTPSGISYVVENRRAMTHVFPELFASTPRASRVRLSDPLARRVPRDRATGPQRSERRRVHARRAQRRVLRALVPRPPDGRRAGRGSRPLLSRERRVHAYDRRRGACRRHLPPHRRRVPRPAPLPPGFVDRLRGSAQRARAGNVTLANFPGNGVADDKAVYPYVPAMIEYYLEETPILGNVETFDLADGDVCEWALERVDELVWKPVDGSGGKGLVIGPAADDATLEQVRTSVAADRRGWIAQLPITLSTSPTYVDGVMAPRHIDLRPFALHDGEDVWVVPGGLTRVALPAGSLVVNSSQGGGSKDTWVLAGPAAPEPPAPAAARGRGHGAPAVRHAPRRARRPP